MQNNTYSDFDGDKRFNDRLKQSGAGVHPKFLADSLGENTQNALKDKEGETSEVGAFSVSEVGQRNEEKKSQGEKKVSSSVFCSGQGAWMIGGLLLVLLVAGGAGVFSALYAQPIASMLGIPIPESAVTSRTVYTSSYPDARSVDAPSSMVAEQSSIISVVDVATPAVASIVVTKDVPIYRESYGSPFDIFRDPFGSRYREQTGTETRKVGGGTGFFISADGLVVTNKHVVSDTTAEYTVILSDGTEYPATVLARDPNRDIAVLEVEGEDFPVLELGDSDEIKVGQTVIAIGNSLGEFSNSVSRGIVSGLGREVVAGSGFGESEQLDDIIQTDAAINPGNSGGPLLDIYGRVIGVNTAVAQGAENVGFALPINSLKNTLDQVKENGKLSIPFIGIRYIPVDAEMQELNDLEYDYGILVVRGEERGSLAVIPGSPADKAGIVENDIILEVDGKNIDGETTLGSLLEGKQVGDTIELKVLHRGETKNVNITLEERDL